MSYFSGLYLKQIAIAQQNDLEGNIISMVNVIKNAKGILMSDTSREYSTELAKNAISALMLDPVAAWDLIGNIKNGPSIVRDGIFMECFQVFLLNSCEYDTDRQEFVENNLDSFVVALAEVSPNLASNYQGNEEQLNEYAKRLIKLIDDCGTIQKSYYIACLARAVRAKVIDVNKFFKLCHCIRSLTEEDLLFLRIHITTDIISDDEEYIDDYRSLGLMKDVDGGFSYTKRAFELKKYALEYEGQVKIPDSFPERFKPITTEAISKDDIDKLFAETENNTDKKINDALSWKEF